METIYNGLHVSINVGKGVYVFFPDSGTGKSYLAFIFRELSADPSLRVASYTYTDYTRNFPLECVLDPSKFDIVVIDRYDMFYGVGVESIIQFGKVGTVLVTCNQTPPFPYEQCAIMYYRNVLEVEKL